MFLFYFVETLLIRAFHKILHISLIGIDYLSQIKNQAAGTEAYCQSLIEKTKEECRRREEATLRNIEDMWNVYGRKADGSYEEEETSDGVTETK